MAKSKSTYFCQNCGNQSSKWLGKCPACGEWNTFVEEVISTGKQESKAYLKSVKKVVPQPISDISFEKESRINTCMEEMNRVLGGGMVAGSIILIGGEPGIGNKDCIILNETNTNEIFRHIGDLEPDILVIDSIQTLHTDFLESTAGSISQIRETASEFQKFAKTTNNSTKTITTAA